MHQRPARCRKGRPSAAVQVGWQGPAGPSLVSAPSHRGARGDTGAFSHFHRVVLAPLPRASLGETLAQVRLLTFVGDLLGPMAPRHGPERLLHRPLAS